MSTARIRTGTVLAAALVAASCLALADRGMAGPEGTRYGDVAVSRKDASLIELGRRLFFEPLVSRSGERSCASCHDPEHGFSDPAVVSEDDVGRTVRHSQTLLDGHLNPTAHWDGEFNSIEDLVTARIGLPRGTKGLRSHGAPLLDIASLTAGQPGFDEETRRKRDKGGKYGPPPTRTPDTPSTPMTPKDSDSPRNPVTPRGQAFDLKRLAELPRVQDVLEESGRYATAFRAAFGSDSVTTARIARAVAAYCRSIRSTESPFDRHAAGDEAALSDAAKRGYALFRGRAGCVKCHTLSAKGATRATFTDFEFHNSGHAWLDLEAERRDELRKSDERRLLDRGRERLSTRGRDLRAFKTPTLRDLTRRGPYMHSGRLRTLAGVVRYYARGGSSDPRQDDRIKRFEVSDAEIQDLVAFLESLTGDERPGLAPVAWDARPKTSRLRFVDASGEPLVNLDVQLYPVGDKLPGAGARTDGVVACTTDAKGWVEYAPAPRTHMHVRLAENLVLSQGDLVPDTCDAAVLTVPVRGKTTLMLRIPSSKHAPETLVVEHLDTLVLPGHQRPHSKLVRGVVLLTGNVQTVRYKGWFRTDVPAQVLVRVPNQGSYGGDKLTVTLKPGKVTTLDLIP